MLTEGQPLVGTLVSMTIWAVILLFLFRPDVREAFRRGRTVSPRCPRIARHGRTISSLARPRPLTYSSGHEQLDSLVMRRSPGDTPHQSWLLVVLGRTRLRSSIPTSLGLTCGLIRVGSGGSAVGCRA
jgi:hypothetical protein